MLPSPLRALAHPATVLVILLWLVGTIDGDARATGLLGKGASPLELRVAIALGPDRSTLWAEMVLDGDGGSVALVVPAGEGAVLDWSNVAWFEALEVSTAPRVLPPEGQAGTCPGDPPAEPVDVVGEEGHTQPLVPLEVAVLDDAEQVGDWAAEAGLSISTATEVGLEALAPMRFVVARFTAPAGKSLTPVLRVVSQTVTPVLPLVLTEASGSGLLVTTWVLGGGRGKLEGAEATLPPATLTFDAASGTSDYREKRRETLAAAPAGASLLESAGHGLYVDATAATGKHVVPSLVKSYFERAASYLGPTIDAPSCVAQAKAALASADPVSRSCARGDLGTVGQEPGCVEVVQGDETDPEELRCTAAVDDLAVALSGQVPIAAWLTRRSLWLPAGASGAEQLVSIETADAESPVLAAGELDLSGCAGGTGGSGGSTSSSSSGTGASGAGASSSGHGTVKVPVYAERGGCGSHEVGTEVLYWLTVDEEDYPPDYYVYAEDDCGGDASDSYAPVYEEDGDSYPDEGTTSDDCSGDSSDGYDDSGDDCSGDSSDGYDDSADDCGGDSSDGYDDSADDCSGDSGDGYDSGDECGGDSGSSSDFGDDCGGDSGGSSGFGDDCSVGARPGARRGPRLSPIVLGSVLVLLPLRRRGRVRGERADGAPRALGESSERSRRVIASARRGAGLRSGAE